MEFGLLLPGTPSQNPLVFPHPGRSGRWLFPPHRRGCAQVSTARALRCVGVASLREGWEVINQRPVCTYAWPTDAGNGVVKAWGGGSGLEGLTGGKGA